MRGASGSAQAGSGHEICFWACLAGAGHDDDRTGDGSCWIRFHAVSAAEVDRKRVYGFAGVRSGYCRTYAAGDRTGDDILFVLLECDRRG